MKRLAVLVLTIAGVIGVVPATSGALPPGVVPGPNSITGTVTDQNGQPVNDVFISDDSGFFSTATDFDGTYLLEGLTAGTQVTVQATDNFGRFLPAQSQPVIVSDVGTVVADIVMQPIPTASVSGTVTDQNGTPLAGITVRETFGSSTTATTDATGHYVLDGLRLDQSHQLTAEDPAGLHQNAFSDLITVAADGSTVVNFTLNAFTIAATGTITGPGGLPLEGIQVAIAEFGGPAVFTDAAGRFALAFQFPPTGTFTLDVNPRVARPDLRPTQVPIDLVAGTVVDTAVQLTQFPTFDVTVTAGGAPADATVAVWTAQPFGRVVARRPVGPDGTVSLPIPADGDYSLEVTSNTPDFAGEFFPDTVFRADAQRFTVVGEQHIPVAIDLERSATISGTITMPDGSFGDFTQVTAFPVGSDESGDQQVCNLPSPDDPPGTYRVGCLHPSVDWLIKGFGNGVADHAYYVDSQSAFNATPIAVDAGQTVTGIDLRLHPKSPDPTIDGLSQQYFITGTTTPGVHVFGTNFPADPHAIQLTSDNFLFGAQVQLSVTAVLSPTELVATVQVSAGDIGPVPISRRLFLNTSIGTLGVEGPTFLIGDPTTPVATMSGRVTDSRGRGIPNVSVIITSTTLNEFGNPTVNFAASGADGRWSAQGISPNTVTVKFEGTERFNSQFWKQRTTQTAATPITLKNGDVRTGINATLTARGPIKVFAASPKLQVPNLSFDLAGQGLGSIRGGFRVSIATAFGNFGLQTQPVSSTRLHVTGFAFPGTWDIVTEWTGDDGTTKSTTCVGCIKVYDDLSAFSFDNFVAPGNTATITYFGSGLVDITKVSVGGRDVRVLSHRTFDGGSIEITFEVKKGAALGSRPVTITRIDGRSTTTDLVVGSPF